MSDEERLTEIRHHSNRSMPSHPALWSDVDILLRLLAARDAEIAELQKLFRECGEARDNVGFLGSVPECIADLAAEREAAREELRASHRAALRGIGELRAERDAAVMREAKAAGLLRDIAVYIDHYEETEVGDRLQHIDLVPVTKREVVLVAALREIDRTRYSSGTDHLARVWEITRATLAAYDGAK